MWLHSMRPVFFLFSFFIIIWLTVLEGCVFALCFLFYDLCFFLVCVLSMRPVFLHKSDLVD